MEKPNLSKQLKVNDRRSSSAARAAPFSSLFIKAWTMTSHSEKTTEVSEYYGSLINMMGCHVSYQNAFVQEKQEKLESLTVRNVGLTGCLSHTVQSNNSRKTLLFQFCSELHPFQSHQHASPNSI